jgi:hypothetical protein
MSIELPANPGKIRQLDDSRWDDAIVVAQEELKEALGKAKRLQNAIRVFQANKRDGVKWPETNSTGESDATDNRQEFAELS